MKSKSLQIGRLKTKNNVFVAPLAGFSDFAFRNVCYSLGAGLSFTEMVSAKGILYDNKNTLDLLRTTDAEYIKAAQIFGSDPKIMAEVCKGEALSKFDIIDINMGCPVPKVFNNGEGSALLRDPILCEKIVSACVETGKTVTVKMRLGVSKNEITAVEVAKRVEGAGASLITVHARTREDYYGPNIDYVSVKKVVESVKIPVIFNGSVFSVEDADNALNKTGAAGVMLARGAMTTPWLINELIGGLMPDKKAIIKRHIELESNVYGETFAAIKLRKQMSFYLKNCRGAKALRVRAIAASSVKELYEIIDQAEFDV